MSFRTLLPSAAASCAALCLSSCGGGGGTLVDSHPAAPSVLSVAASPSSITIDIGSQATASATVAGVGGASVSQAVTWESSVASYFSVSQGGVVSGVSAGTGGVVRARSASDPSKVSPDVPVVVNPCTVRSVSISGGTSVGVGQTLQLTAVVDAQPCASRNVTWSASAPNILTLSATGVVTGVGLGATTITARSVEDFSKFANLGISVVAVDPCALRAYVVGSSVSGTLSSLSCQQGQDWYTYTTTASTTIIDFVMTSSAFPARMGPVIPANSNWFWSSLGSPGTLHAIAITSAGSRSLMAATDDGRFGAYSLSSTVNPVITGCPAIHVTTGVSALLTLGFCQAYTPQNAAATFANGHYLAAPIGTPVTARVTATSFAPLIEIRNTQGTLIASSAGQTGSTVEATFTTTQGVSDHAIIWVTARVPFQIASSYTFTILP